MSDVVMYSTATCPYCIRAKELLRRKGVEFHDIRVDLNPHLKEEMIEKSGRRTVPQIFIHGEPIGGCDDLHALEAEGLLDSILKRKQS